MPARFEKLLTILLDPFSWSPQELVSTLTECQDLFVDLLATKPRKDEERRAVESGQATIDGNVHKFPDGFKQEVLFLAQELDISEYYCAGLLLQAYHEDRKGASVAAESAMMIYYNERADCLRCLKLIFEGAFNSAFAEQGIAATLESYAVSIMNASERKMLSRVLAEIDKCTSARGTQSMGLQQSNPTTYSYGIVQQPRSGVKFGEVAIQERIKRLGWERRQLGHLLFYIATSFALQPDEITMLIKWLQASEPSDELVLYVFAALSAALDTSSLEQGDLSAAKPLYQSPAALKSVTHQITNGSWKVAPLKAAVFLQWTLFLNQGCAKISGFSDKVGVFDADVDRFILQAIHGDAFPYLTSLIMDTRPLTYYDEDNAALQPMVALSVPTNVSRIEQDFRLFALRSVELLVIHLIKSATPVLRKIRQREEDSVHTGPRPTRGFGSSHGTEPPKQARHDIEALLTLIAVVYADSPPDAGTRFWQDPENKLVLFLLWSADAQSTPLQTANFEMLASLAKGTTCSIQTHNFLSPETGNNAGTASKVCSWSAIYNSLAYYSKEVPNPSTMQSTGRAMTVESRGIAPEDVRLLKAVLRLIKNVVKGHPLARASLNDNQGYKAMSTLLELSVCAIPLDLKAALFNAMAAFCTGNDPGAIETARQLWYALEKAEVLPLRNIPTPNSSQRQSRPVGLLAELEQVEVPGRTFPSTIAFINLLSALIHVPKNTITLRRRVDYQSIPNNLGSGYRTPGLHPYVKFVVDDVLLKAGHREYADPKEKWTVVDVCLCFVEKCLASYDLNSLLADGFMSSRANVQSPNLLASMKAHPGYDILRRISVDDTLNRDNLSWALFAVVDVGYDSVENFDAQTPLCEQAIKRSLRIIYRVLDVQKLYLEVLLPIVVEEEGASNVDKTVLINPISLDQRLLQSLGTVEQIALFVNRYEEQEIVYLVIRIVTILSDSAFFNALDDRNLDGERMGRMTRLAAFLSSVDNSARIMEGFAGLLEIETSEELDVEEGIDTILGDVTEPRSLSQAIRSAILDLLLLNTTPGRSAPNFAHFLMNFKMRGQIQAEALESLRVKGVQRSCLHVILDLLSAGIASMGKAASGPQLFSARHPSLAEKCYRLVYQLCVHTWTSSSVLRYLRTEEDFATRHLVAIPMRPIPVSGTAKGLLAYPDETKIPTTCGAVAGFLRLRSWLLEIVALELHILVETDQRTPATRLVETLFGSGPNMDFEDEELGDVDFRDVSFNQSPARIMDLFLSFDFEWKDAISAPDGRFKYYPVSEIKACLKVDETGCKVYDSQALLASVNATRLLLQRQGSISNQAQKSDFDNETISLLKWAAVENHRSEIAHAREMGLASWRRTLEIALGRCFGLIPADLRGCVLYELLSYIPPRISASTTSETASTILSEVALSLVTKLREQATGSLLAARFNVGDISSSLPMERLGETFQAILQAVVRPGTTEAVRGNLYSVLINCFHLLGPLEKGSDADRKASTSPGDDATSNSGSVVLAMSGVGRRGLPAQGLPSSLDVVLDKLVSNVCKDAANTREVWKTVAFTFLDALVAATQKGRSRNALSIMTRHGFLRTFVQSLKDSEEAIFSVLRPDAGSLNALYVYEAKMGLLLRIAKTGRGAEALLDADVFPVLSQCEYLQALPHEEDVSMDDDSFLPSTSERYHQLLLPALQLVVSVIASIDNASSGIRRLALNFLVAHRDAILPLLRDDNFVSLTMLREYHLIVCLATHILPIIKPEDLITQAGFGPIHTAILGLSAKSMTETWQGRIGPVNETERYEDSQPALVLRKDFCIFEEKLQTVLTRLHECTLLYLTSVMEMQGFTQVLLPIKATSLEGSTNARLVASLPTLPSVIHTMQLAAASLTSSISFAEELFQINAPEELTSGERKMVLQITGPKTDENGGETSYQSMVLKHSLMWAKCDCLSRLHTMEMLMLLTWRHLEFFLNAQRPQAHVAFQLRSQTIAGNWHPDELKVFARKELATLLTRLQDLFLTKEATASNFKISTSYLQILARKIHETIGDILPNGAPPTATDDMVF